MYYYVHCRLHRFTKIQEDEKYNYRLEDIHSMFCARKIHGTDATSVDNS